MANADVRSRRRRGTILAGAIFLGLIGLQAVSMSAPITPGAARGVEIVRMAGFCALVVVLALRSTTAFSLVGRNAELDDELSRANRAPIARLRRRRDSSRRCWAAWLRGLRDCSWR